jgi:hypothetical protein
LEQTNSNLRRALGGSVEPGYILPDVPPDVY